MHKSAINLQHKKYNPCGNLTGRECELCENASKKFFTLPFKEVMRSESAQALSKLERENKFRNVAALENWASHNLNEVEQQAVITFKTSSRLHIGLAKYLTHVLYENRYNIHYNELVDYCGRVNDESFSKDLTCEKLECEINSLAQEADYSTTYEELNEKLNQWLRECIRERHRRINDDIIDTIIYEISHW